ncbi:asparaginase, partial [Klenkia terrae]
VDVVRAILAQAGLDESALRCPPDLPEDEETRLRLLRAGESASRVRMNCSGKHAAMLLACTTNGWPTEGHLHPDHPLQRLVRDVVARETGTPVGHTAVDGCGAALFGTTVRGLATAFRSLALATDGPAAQVAAAMRAHPEFVGGRGHVNTRLMADLRGVVAKGGAEGVIGVAGPGGQAVAMKVVDGSPRATTVVALAVLRGLGVDTTAVADLTTVPVLGGGVPVGEVRPGAALAAW